MKEKGHIEERKKQTNKVKGLLRGQNQIIIIKLTLDTERRGQRICKASMSICAKLTFSLHSLVHLIHFVSVILLATKLLHHVFVSIELHLLHVRKPYKRPSALLLLSLFATALNLGVLSVQGIWEQV